MLQVRLISLRLLMVLMVVVMTSATSPVAAMATPDFGSNVIIFDPSMATSVIQAAVDAIASQQVDNEMGTQRYALLFMPGTYGSAANPLVFQVGYYTEVAVAWVHHRPTSPSTATSMCTTGA